jgi:hypothetical protein
MVGVIFGVVMQGSAGRADLLDAVGVPLVTVGGSRGRSLGPSGSRGAHFGVSFGDPARPSESSRRFRGLLWKPLGS